MKFCVVANLRLETKAKRDKLDDDIRAKVKGKPVWGETVISKGEDEGHPTHGLTIRFDNEADMDELFVLIKDKMEKIPVLTGTVSQHLCSHDEGNVPCVILERFEK